MNKNTIEVFAVDFLRFFAELAKICCKHDCNTDIYLNLNAQKIVVKEENGSVKVIKNRFGKNIATSEDCEYFDSRYKLRNIIAGRCFEPIIYDKLLFFEAFSKNNQKDFLIALEYARDI